MLQVTYRRFLQLNLLSHKMWIFLSFLLFLLSTVPAFIMGDGAWIICTGKTTWVTPQLCSETYQNWARWAFFSMFSMSIISSIIAFREDKKRFRLLWVTTSWVVPTSSIFILIGYNTKFCLMWSCSDFGELAVAISLFCFTVFIFGLSLSQLLEKTFNKITKRKLFWISYLLISILYVAAWYAIDTTSKHEREITHSFKLSFDKQGAINECKRAFFQSSKNSCLNTYAIKFHDTSMCRGISPTQKADTCDTEVRCSYFHPLYKSWRVGSRCGVE